MVRWHETLAARVGLRAAGLAGLCAAWGVAGTLYARVHSHPPAQASLEELGLSTVLVLLLIVSNALLFAGAGLWKVVPVPGRRVTARTEPPVFEPLTGRETSLAEALRRAQTNACVPACRLHRLARTS